MIRNVTFNRERVGFRSRMLGFVWYPQRRPRILYGWFGIGIGGWRWSWHWGWKGNRFGNERTVG